MKSFVLRCFYIAALMVCTHAQAHEVRPAIADIQFLSDSTFKVSIQANLEALLAGIGPQHKDTQEAPNAAKYDGLRNLDAVALQAQYAKFSNQYAQGIALSFEGVRVKMDSLPAQIPQVGDIRKARLSKLEFSGVTPRLAKKVGFKYAPEFGNIAVKFRHNDQPAQSVHWLVGGKPSPDFPLNQDVVPQAWSTVALNYIVLGFEHIVPKGLDHILFVLGLFLLTLQARPLLMQVTAFTLAHSITLGLSIYGVISLSPTIVEPLIALSIIYIGVENILRARNSASRLIVIFLFGLLHGLGFSSVLSEIGLPRADFLTALITFNLGVEFGQLAVIAAAFLVVMGLGLKGHPRYRQWIVIPGSALISLIGLYWFIERTLGFPG